MFGRIRLKSQVAYEGEHGLGGMSLACYSSTPSQGILGPHRGDVLLI